MPGLAICLSATPISVSRREALRGAAELMRHQPRYSTTTITEQDHADVRFTACDQYPRLLAERGGLRLFIEGAIYNKAPEQVCSELAQLGTRVFNSHGDSEQRTQQWLLENDGEYIALVIDPSAGRLALITDALGRLPLFYQELPGSILISREQKYIIAASGNKRLDPVGVAEFLLFAYNIGSRTMSEGIKRFDPATLIRFDSHDNRIHIRSVHCWQLGEGFDSSRGLAVTADAVAQRIREAARTRARYRNDGCVVLSLSGGLDSRAVAAALHREQVKYSSITTLNIGHGNQTDVDLARRVAGQFSDRHIEYLEPVTTLAGVQSLIRHQEGGSMAAMTASQQHLERLEDDLRNDTILFTGDGGNNVMYPYLPNAAIQTVDDIVEQAFGTVYYWDIRVIEQLLRVDGAQVRQEYREVLESYPETEPQWKYGHFKFMGRPYRFVMEGEDRTRFHFWLGAPFWSLPLVRLLLTVPECQKASYRLYRAVLNRLDPRCLQIPYAATFDIKVPIRFLTLYSETDRLIKSHSGLYRGLRGLLVRRNDPGYCVPAWEDALRRIVQESSIVREYFDVKKLTAALDAGLSRITYNLLATILFKIDLMEGDFRPQEGQRGRSRFQDGTS